MINEFVRTFFGIDRLIIVDYLELSLYLFAGMAIAMMIIEAFKK